MSEAFDPARVRALLFDIDGTLADTDDAWVRRISRLLLPLAHFWPAGRPTRWGRRVVMAAETPMNLLYAWWDRLHLDEVLAPLARLLSTRKPIPRKHVPLIPGVRELLEHAREDHKLAVVTARGQRQALTALANMELEGAFDLIVTTRTTRRAKPHPAPVLWAAQQLGVAPGACLMIGDTTLDVRAGRAAGAQTAAVLCGFGEREELLAARPTLLLESTGDLLNHLP